MLCQACKKRKATVRVSEMQKDGKHTEIHLCEECAKQYGVSLKFSFSELLGNLISSQLGTRPEDANLKCPNCGLMYSEFQSAGRLGCPQDYEIFRQNLVPLIERVHSGLQHVGKAPKNVGRTYRVEREMNRLQKELEAAVAREDYENAALLRDKIHNLRHGSKKKTGRKSHTEEVEPDDAS